MCPWRSEEGVGGPGTGVMKRRGLPHGCWEWNLAPLQEQQMLSTAEPIPSPSFPFCMIVVVCFPEHRSHVSPMQYVECMPGNGIARPRDLQTFSIIVSQQVIRVKVMPWSGFQVISSLRP